MIRISMIMGYETVLYASLFELYSKGRVANSKKMYSEFTELNLLLTSSLREAESFLISYPVLSWSRNSPHL
jgi:hypothetical protein